MDRGILYIHGKGGSHLEAQQYAECCPGFEITGVAYDESLPWLVEGKIKSAYDTLHGMYEQVYLLANSIGAYFAMHTLQSEKIEQALFISPVLDMERLILEMMKWAGVSEEELHNRGEIPTDFVRRYLGNICVLSGKILFIGALRPKSFMGRRII